MIKYETTIKYFVIVSEWSFNKRTSTYLYDRRKFFCRFGHMSVDPTPEYALNGKQAHYLLRMHARNKPRYSVKKWNLCVLHILVVVLVLQTVSDFCFFFCYNPSPVKETSLIYALVELNLTKETLPWFLCTTCQSMKILQLVKGSMFCGMIRSI